MSPIDRVGDLEINEDIALERRSWRIERIGWAVMAFALVAAALGLFGDGLFSQASVRSESGAFSVEYPRFARRDAPATVKFHLYGPSSADGQYHLWIAHEYLEHVQMDSMTPESASTAIADGGVDFTFPTAGAAGPVTIGLALRYESVGRLAGKVGVSSDDAVSIRQFVCP